MSTLAAICAGSVYNARELTRPGASASSWWGATPRRRTLAVHDLATGRVRPWRAQEAQDDVRVNGLLFRLFVTPDGASHVHDHAQETANRCVVEGLQPPIPMPPR